MALKTRKMLERTIASHPAIERVQELLTMYISPDDILLVAHVDFVDDYDAAQVENAIAEIERELTKRLPELKHIYIEPRHE